MLILTVCESHNVQISEFEAEQKIKLTNNYLKTVFL